MNKITIGIPRGLLYYKYENLWKEFFKELDINIIISPKTNKNIIEQGNKYVIDEACLSLKIFMGHVAYLQDKCDYVLIPRIACVKTNEKLCTNFLAIYDLVQNCFPDLKILHYNVDVEEKEYEIDGFLNMAKKLDINYVKALKAYEKAKQKEQELFLSKINKQNKKINNNKLKIMLVAHPYNLYDEFIGQPIIKYLETENISVILSDIFDNNHKNVNCKDISTTIYWTFNKELMAAISKYKTKVDGIILLSTFPCGPDSLANELVIRRIKNIPICYLTFDNNSSDTGLITRLESFIDIIKIKKERTIKHNEKTCY